MWGPARPYAGQVDRCTVATARGRGDGGERRLGVGRGRGIVRTVFAASANEVPGIDPHEERHQPEEEDERAEHDGGAWGVTSREGGVDTAPLHRMFSRRREIAVPRMPGGQRKLRVRSASVTGATARGWRR